MRKMNLVPKISARNAVGILFVLLILSFPFLGLAAGGGTGHSAPDFPPSFESYGDGHMDSVMEILENRMIKEPFNLVVSIIFLFAVLHAFVAAKLTKISHRFQHEHEAKLRKREARVVKKKGGAPQKYKGHVNPVSFKAELFHFLGEVEAIFGIWSLVLAGSFLLFKDLSAFLAYTSSVNYTEPLFVVVIMVLSASRPVIYYSEQMVMALAKMMGNRPWHYWAIILTVTPILGSFITEPAAMTIAALLLSKKIYREKIPTVFAYATLGLLFVNISVGGTLTNFAAPPVLIVAAPWKWSTWFMASNFGWKAFAGILTANAVYLAVFRKVLFGMKGGESSSGKQDRAEIAWAEREEPVPFGIFLIHILFILVVVLAAHYPVIFMATFLFFVAFTITTAHHQNPLSLKSPILVGFFLAGLVTHGGLQGWWIAPVLASMGELTLFWAATGLTAFNDNAAITYLSTLVPEFSDAAKYAVVAGAVTGGGLTVIANAPNPAGQAILNKHFKGGINPLGLLLGALPPTLIVSFYFLAF